MRSSQFAPRTGGRYVKHTPDDDDDKVDLEAAMYESSSDELIDTLTVFWRRAS